MSRMGSRKKNLSINRNSLKTANKTGLYEFVMQG